VETSLSEQPSPLEFLRAVYLNDQLPLSVRMRAAIEAAPYYHAKLAVTAVIGDADSFAAMLDRAIARSQAPPKVIEHRPGETAPSVKWSGPLHHHRLAGATEG
jgi:hypothetical protein